MPRPLSAHIVEALNAEASGEILLWLATIEAPGLETPLRVVNNTEDIESRGNTFTAMGFRVGLPEDIEGGIRRGRVTFDNVTQWLTPTIRSLTGPFTVALELVSATNLASSPPVFDTVEIAPLPFVLDDLQYNAVQVDANMSYEGISGRAFPTHTFNPALFPGLF